MKNQKTEKFYDSEKPVLCSDEYYYTLVNNKERRILLYDEINENSSYIVNLKLRGMALDNPKQPIILEICSSGGNVSSGYSIINTIKNIASPVITIVNGEACSMSALIFIVGDKRLMYESSYIMFHPLSEGQVDYLNFIKDRTRFLITLEKNMSLICQQYTKFNKEEYMRMQAGELWLTAKQAKSKGVCDKVIK
jgi:ATP-dependent Clp protease protease subunit